MTDLHRMVLMLELLLLVAVVWVAYDSSRRDWRGVGFADASWKWVAGVLLLWFVAFPLYLVYRRRAPLTGTAPTADPFAAPERPASSADSVPPPGWR